MLAFDTNDCSVSKVTIWFSFSFLGMSDTGVTTFLLNFSSSFLRAAFFCLLSHYSLVLKSPLLKKLIITIITETQPDPKTISSLLVSNALHFLILIGSTLYKNEVIIIYWRRFSEGTPEKHKRVAVCKGPWEKHQASVEQSLRERFLWSRVWHSQQLG